MLWVSVAVVKMPGASVPHRFEKSLTVMLATCARREKSKLTRANSNMAVSSCGFVGWSLETLTEGSAERLRFKKAVNIFAAVSWSLACGGVGVRG